MNLLFNRMGLKPRVTKPRTSGVTMVLDKSQGVRAAADLIELGADYIDIVKLGWGTSALYSEEVLRKKIAMYREAGIYVCPGGTFIEAAFEYTDVAGFLDALKEVGFNAIEVSDGIHPKMSRQDKLDIIALAVAKGFYTVSEVGKKFPEEDKVMSYTQRINEIREDLAQGASKVIMEARESGTVGIFDTDGKINSELAYELFLHIEPNLILWEAPLKFQQVWLIQQLGADVNIGNVAPADVLSLESMRYGLRADTFRDFCVDNIQVFLELGPAGAIRAQQRGDVVVVIDALRASATIVQCLDKGAKEVIPIVNAQELTGEVTIGERGGAKLPNADLGNSPLQITPEVVQGKSVVITTTNGTECIRSAKGEDNTVFIATVTNCAAVAQVAVKLAKQLGVGISLVAAGRNNLPAIEDVAAATEIVKALGNVTLKGTLEPYYSDALERDFLASDSGVNLVSLGYIDDVIFCSQKDIASVVPYFDGERILPYKIDQ